MNMLGMPPCELDALRKLSECGVQYQPKALSADARSAARANIVENSVFDFTDHDRSHKTRRMVHSGRSHVERGATRKARR